jgi:hypothetical protein
VWGSGLDWWNCLCGWKYVHGVKPILFSVLVNGDIHRLLIYHKGFRVWGGECEGGKDA